eukprot:8739516-Pyramimonas_sp.AAC.1
MCQYADSAVQTARPAWEEAEAEGRPPHVHKSAGGGEAGGCRRAQALPQEHAGAAVIHECVSEQMQPRA